MRSLRNKYTSRYLFLICLSFLIQACDQPTVVRQYHEVVIDIPPKEPMAPSDPHAMLSNMPDDDIHKNLKMKDSGLDSRLSESVAPAAITWDVPEGWLEKKGDGMRLASFVNTDVADPVEITIISLAGQAGGFSANITRWLKQLTLTLPEGMDIEKFISLQEKLVNSSGMEVILVDFTKLQDNSDSKVDSMLSAVMDRKNSQIFIKMTGTRTAILKNYEAFKSLIMSIKPTDSE